MIRPSDPDGGYALAVGSQKVHPFAHRGRAGHSSPDTIKNVST
jgi:hypothetical protein